MKSILTKKALSLALAALAMLTTGCIKEDLDECYKLTLKVVNHKGDDITALSVVSEAKLFIYDANSKLLGTRDLNDAFIRGRETIELNYPESSKLHLIAWGNLKGNQDVSDATKAEDLTVSLRNDEMQIAQSPDSLFFGDIDVTVRGNGVAGENQEIVLEPKTGTVEMRTLNLQYALKTRGLRATDECDFYMDRTLNTMDYKGELTGDSVYYNPDADWKGSEWETTAPQSLYLGQNMTGSIQVGNERYEVKEGTFDDGTTGPIEIHPFQRTLVLFEWGEDGAFLGAKIKVTPWGVVDDDIDW